VKSLTHNVFSIGLMVFVVSLFGDPLLVTLVVVAVAVYLTNLLIDRLGHSKSEGVMRRTWLTHSLLTAPAWGAVAWGLTLTVFLALRGFYPPEPILLAFFMSLGGMAGWSHLLLDALTEGGVFGFSRRREALAHFSYDNVPLNLSFCLLGVFLFLLAAFP